jgi:monoamine oxidase
LTGASQETRERRASPLHARSQGMTSPPGQRALSWMAQEIARSLSDAQPRVFWSDRADAPAPAPSLAGAQNCDLVIVGGGFTGLWAAIQAKEQDPSRDVVVLEAETGGFGASGRNGGFVDASLTHGLRNGVRHFGHETAVLHQLGLENFDEIAATLNRHHIDADWDPRGILYVATEPYQVNYLNEEAELLTAHGENATVLNAVQTRAELDSRAADHVAAVLPRMAQPPSGLGLR